MNATAPLPVEELAHRCDAGQFAFATTEELEDIGVIPGQERAIDAIELAAGIDRDGYNLFNTSSTVRVQVFSICPTAGPEA